MEKKLTPDEEQIRDDILDAKDVVEVKDAKSETVRAPNAARGTTRELERTWTSPTVRVGKVYKHKYTYIDRKGKGPGWGAKAGITEIIE